MGIAALIAGRTSSQVAAYGLAACLAVAGIGVASGVWLGIRWQKGVQAINDVAIARAQMQEIKQQARNNIQDLRTAADRLGVISGEYEDERARLRHTIDSSSTRLAAFVAAHPEIRDCDIGTDGLQLWNAALGPTAAAAGDPAEPEATLSGPAAGDGQPTAGVAGKSSGGGRGGTGVRAEAATVEPGDQRARGDGISDVQAVDRGASHDDQAAPPLVEAPR